MVGIYKITNPKGKVYIGQSTNIERRFRQYYNIKSSKLQLKLHYSFLKYGIENHNFEIICLCDLKDLNITERYYQETYNAVYNGLNCVFTTESENKEYVAGRPQDNRDILKVSLLSKTNKSINYSIRLKDGVSIADGLQEIIKQLKKNK